MNLVSIMVICMEEQTTERREQNEQTFSINIFIKKINSLDCDQETVGWAMPTLPVNAWIDEVLSQKAQELAG